mmetsp:Transcript_38601/g.81092  ORF Transcript_38601/g.81092 Transcript_38601/m.81092 type:complete len:104 (-) Transcript_38601:341-652(-)
MLVTATPLPFMCGRFASKRSPSTKALLGSPIFFNKLWQIQSPENDPRIKAIEFVPRTQQIVYVWESPADDIIEEAASFSMIREEDYKVASVWLAFNGPPFPES